MIALLTFALLILGLHVPMLGDPSALAGVVALLVFASLGLGLLVAAVSDSERQAVQLSLLLLLASVFFSGFVLGTDQFNEPVRSMTALLPVTNGIQLIGDVMLRGSTDAIAQVWALVAEIVAYTGIAWLIIRRVCGAPDPERLVRRVCCGVLEDLEPSGLGGDDRDAAAGARRSPSRSAMLICPRE